MPIRIDETLDGGVVLNATGHVTGAEIAEVNGSLYASDDMIRNTRYQLWDFTDMAVFGYEYADVERIIAQDAYALALNNDMLVAVVADMDLFYGFSRIWETALRADNRNASVFRTRESAEGWINKKLRERSRDSR